MIVTKISDGLGNQLFMYACGFACSKRLNVPLVLDATQMSNNQLRQLEINKFNLRYDRMVLPAKSKIRVFRALKFKIIRMFYKSFLHYYREKQNFVLDNAILNIERNSYLDGYWQNEKYFIEYRKELLDMITPKIVTSEGYNKYAALIKECNSVAVHIRLGDYCKSGLCVDDSYYSKAIAYLKSQIGDKVKLFLFSDDVEKATEIFSKFGVPFQVVSYSSENKTVEDLLLMSLCKCNIIANSSYSWWGAWLNNNVNKVVVCPETDMWIEDFYPTDWCRIKL